MGIGIELKEQAEGRKDDSQKIRTDLLSVPALMGTALVLTHGAVRYGARNWEQGLEWHRPYGALLRHVFAWWMGEDRDRDDNIHHLHHAACELMFLQHYVETGTGRDNRPLLDKKTSEVGQGTPGPELDPLIYRQKYKEGK